MQLASGLDCGNKSVLIKIRKIMWPKRFKKGWGLNGKGSDQGGVIEIITASSLRTSKSTTLNN
jgi:hypothetical protein